MSLEICVSYEFPVIFVIRSLRISYLNAFSSCSLPNSEFTFSATCAFLDLESDHRKTRLEIESTVFFFCSVKIFTYTWLCQKTVDCLQGAFKLLILRVVPFSASSWLAFVVFFTCECALDISHRKAKVNGARIVFFYLSSFVFFCVRLQLLRKWHFEHQEIICTKHKHLSSFSVFFSPLGN